MLVDKPVIQYGVEEAVQSGIDNIVIVTSRGKSIIEDHFDVAFELESVLEQRGKKDQLDEIRHLSKRINVASVRQGEPLGLGHAVLVARHLVGDEPFAVMLSDDVIDATPPALRQMIDVFERVNGPVIAVERVPPEDVSSYGIVAIDDSAILAPASIASPISSRSHREKRRLRIWRSSAATSSRQTSSLRWRRRRAIGRERFSSPTGCGVFSRNARSTRARSPGCGTTPATSSDS